LHNSLKASRAAALAIPESAQESTTLQRVVLNRPGPCSPVSAASVFTSRPSSYLTDSSGKFFPQESELFKHDTNFTNPHELTQTN
jgi:hypothetical protein